jgi:hypothetical protein
MSDLTTEKEDDESFLIFTKDELVTHLSKPRNQRTAIACVKEVGAVAMRLVELTRGTGTELTKALRKAALDHIDRVPSQKRGSHFEELVVRELAPLVGSSWDLKDVSKDSRSMDIVLTHKKTGSRIGIECKCTKAVTHKDVEKFNRDKIFSKYDAAIFISRSKIPGKRSPVHVDHAFNEIFITHGLNLCESLAHIQTFIELTFVDGVCRRSEEAAIRSREAVMTVEATKRDIDAVTARLVRVHARIRQFTDSYPSFVHEDVKNTQWVIQKQTRPSNSTSPTAIAQPSVSTVSHPSSIQKQGDDLTTPKRPDLRTEDKPPSKKRSDNARKKAKKATPMSTQAQTRTDKDYSTNSHITKK